jgi:hypothetical protein
MVNNWVYQLSVNPLLSMTQLQPVVWILSCSTLLVTFQSSCIQPQPLNLEHSLVHLPSCSVTDN